MRPINLQALATNHRPLREAAERSLAHEFDLLGSGPVVVAHGVSCIGIGGHRYPPKEGVNADSGGEWLGPRMSPGNVRQCQQIWQLVDERYIPIDWQLDIRSGWRWSERTWYRDIEIGRQPGADIKLPWELSRLQHLPQLAIEATLRGSAGGAIYAREVRNQLLDFIATNPPRFGANWVTAMDVAIRTANVLLARDILVLAGHPFDAAADAVIRRSIFEHAVHIASNLEWDPVLRGNHYLSDLVGLLFAAKALAAEPESARWLSTSTTELLSELRLQFNPDGSNFEGSTSYHGLSTELALYALALLVADAATEGTLPSDLGARIHSMLEFDLAVTGPDGRVVQFGDTDSGRLFVPVPDVDPLDHARLHQAAAPLLEPGGMTTSAPVGIDGRVIESLSGGHRISVAPVGRTSRDVRIGNAASLDSVVQRIGGLSPRSRAHYRIQRTRVDAAVELFGFPDGGFWIARAADFMLSIRCGAIGQRGNGGHDHDDQLSMDLWLDGDHVIADPGTYVYTSLPKERRRYRSAANHAGPYLAGPEAVGQGRPFALGHAVPGLCLVWGPWGFAGVRKDRFGRTALATVAWASDAIEIRHGVEGGELHPTRLTDDWRCLISAIPYSPGYGRISS